MTDQLILGIVANLPATLTAGAALVVALRTLKVSKATHHNSNSKLDKLEAKLELVLKRNAELEQLLLTARVGRRGPRAQ